MENIGIAVTDGKPAGPGDAEERALEIERSIIKKFRRPIWRRFTKAVHDYQLIQEGDHIACCISGGKDSMLMAKLLQELQRHGMVHFDLDFLCMNPGYNEENWDLIQENAKTLGIPLTHFESQIFDIVADIDKSPCYLCARMRRGYLYSRAKALGCNKIALGHHFDDVIETVLMGMFFAGKIETMMPKLHSRNFPGMELIRPMYLVKEQDVLAWRDYNHLRFIRCACRFTEHMEKEQEETGSRRQDMKQLIEKLRKMDSNIDRNIFNSTHDISLKTILGVHADGWKYSFLDDYDLPEEERWINRAGTLLPLKEEPAGTAGDAAGEGGPA
ncbi:MAG: tRNA 2-thiocytidine biosynthesis protein TtcA [Clostridium sp.]|nr:tRNA 2-thiocytidine biosynthesis protein TtcA [Clostridium sp.]